MSWFLLVIGIVFEVMGTTCMKLSAGFTRTTPSILMFVFWGLGFGFLSIAIKKIDISIAYAIWSGTGIALMGIIGIYWFNESANLTKLVSITLVVLGVIGLNLSGGHAPTEPEPDLPSDDASAPLTPEGPGSDDDPDLRLDPAEP